MAKILGIEIGSARIKLAVTEDGSKKNKVYRCLTVPLPDGIVDDGIIKDPQQIGEIIRGIVKSERLGTKKAVFTVESSRIANREVTIPAVKDKNIQNLIQINSGDYFPIDVSQYQISYSKLGVEELEGKKQLKLLVAAAPKSLVRGYMEAAKEAGLSLKAIDYGGNSLLQAVQSQSRDGIHMYVKIEAKNSQIIVLKDRMMTMQRNVNHGLTGITDYLREEAYADQGLTQAQALELLEKDNFVLPGFDAKGEEFQTEATEGLRYLTNNLLRITDYYSRNKGEDIDDIILIGTGASIKGMDFLLENELGIPIRFMEASKRVENIGAYITAIGCTNNPMNLMEKSISGKKKGKLEKSGKEKKTDGMLITVTAVLCAIVLAGSGLGLRGYQSYKKAKLEERIANLSDIEQIYNNYTKTQQMYDSFQSLYAYTKTPNENLLLFLGELEQKMPKDFTLFSFQATGTTVMMDITVDSKEAAAHTLMQLRTFESLSDVKTTGITDGTAQGGDGNVSFSVTCTYAEEAAISDGSE
ncbi:MAG: pilus assembly protein PilM [Lachnospiraceae bacterium]|nr:pilus assembly protein PilM [Lachnospiraceae bacterium]